MEPGVNSSCVIMFNTWRGGELWQLPLTFLKGQEMEGLRKKNPLRAEWSGLGEI
jgi:hypothetical protein